MVDCKWKHASPEMKPIIIQVAKCLISPSLIFKHSIMCTSLSPPEIYFHTHQYHWRIFLDRLPAVPLNLGYIILPASITWALFCNFPLILTLKIPPRNRRFIVPSKFFTYIVFPIISSLCQEDSMCNSARIPYWLLIRGSDREQNYNKLITPWFCPQDPFFSPLSQIFNHQYS